ncbi:MAG: hypothetical protein AMS27_00090 [Bacteroides sp. SM23_62_1]|nr:MAG: hypothetical protein AMS27_00090 [Bacteroides sp. SM23_62_1]
MLKLFKGNQPALIVIIPLLTGLIWLRSFINPDNINITFDLYEMPFWHFINNASQNQIIIRKIAAFIILIINALWLSRINTRFILLKGRTYLMTLFYGFICSTYLPLHDLNPALLAVTLFIPSIELLLASYKEEKLSYKYFEAALLISIGSFFYSKAAAFLVIIWIALTILKTPGWREWVFTIVGFILPYLFLVTVLYVTNKNIPDYFGKIVMNFNITRGFDYLNMPVVINYAFLFLLILLASGLMIRVYQGLKIYARIYYRFIFWIFVFVLGLFFGLFNHSIELMYFFALPVSYILTFYFFSIRSRLFGEILFGIFIGLIILVVVMS